jgi:putative ABC transport system substrate-binding protein
LDFSRPVARQAIQPSLPFGKSCVALGYVEGQNLVIEFRSAGGNNNRVQVLADELVALPVDIIVTAGAPATLAAKKATSSIPIIVGAIADPIALGVVQNLSRPDANVTGFSSLAPELGTKRLELLRDAIPTLDRVGILWSPANAINGRPQVEALLTAARTLGIATEIQGADSAIAIAGAIEALVNRKVSALIVVADTVFFAEHKQIIGLATAKRLPTIYPAPVFAAAGGLLSYGPDVDEQYRRAARYVDRILKGAKVSDLPIEQPTKFRLIVNLTTAKALEITMPPSLLAVADEVIE